MAGPQFGFTGQRLAGGLNIDRSRRLPLNQYVPEVQKKDLIVLHFTAGGSATGALQSWLATPERVATAYIVDIDARVYEVFPPNCWAAHLGVGAEHNPGYQLDRRSIGIEIVNFGGLRLAPGTRQLNCWPNGYTTRFCSLDDTAAYVKRPFRGIDYFPPSLPHRWTRRSR